MNKTLVNFELKGHFKHFRHPVCRVTCLHVSMIKIMGVGNTEMSARLNPLESPSAVHPELPCDTNQKH